MLTWDCSRLDFLFTGEFRSKDYEDYVQNYHHVQPVCIYLYLFIFKLLGLGVKDYIYIHYVHKNLIKKQKN